MIQYIQQETESRHYRLMINTLKGTYFFLPEHIIRLEARSNYTKFYFSNHGPLLIPKVLKDYEALLEPHGFVRTHRSHLVNKNLIVKIEQKGRIVMQDMSMAEISRRKRNGVMKALRA